MNKTLQIRNSTTEFLIFQSKQSNDPIELRYENETIWISQKMMSKLFEVDRTVVTKHLRKLFEDKEIEKNSVSAKFAHTASDGKKYQTTFYNLEVIISIGYKVNSSKTIEFRKWAIQILTQFSLKGYVIDKKRLENVSLLNKNYFDELLSDIREIRLSERNFSRNQMISKPISLN